MLKACVTSVFSLALCWTLLSTNFVSFRAVAVDVFSLALCRTWLTVYKFCLLQGSCCRCFQRCTVQNLTVYKFCLLQGSCCRCFQCCAVLNLTVGVFSVALCWTWLSTNSICLRAVAVGVGIKPDDSESGHPGGPLAARVVRSWRSQHGLQQLPQRWTQWLWVTLNFIPSQSSG